jgi:hypothetical protein
MARDREALAALARVEELMERVREHQQLADLGKLLAQAPALEQQAGLEELLARARARQEAAQERTDTTNMPVTIYLADEVIHEQVETAVEQWLATADVSIDERAKPVIGSWFRSMRASLKKVVRTPAAQEALLTGIHVADSHFVLAQDAYVTSTLLQNVGPVLQALQPTKDAVVRAGALLIVKVEWVVQVHQLTAAQQAVLDHRPQLAASPTEIIAALQLHGPVSQEAAHPPVVPQVGGSKTTASTGD